MKKILSKYSVLVLGVLMLTSGLTSCDDYLTVRPKSDYPDYQLFTTVTGFKDALIGLYRVAREKVYFPDGPVFGGANTGTASGSAMTTSLLEPISSFWPVYNNTDTNYRLYNHIYTQANNTIHPGIKTFYTGQYEVITNANLILKWIDDDEQDFLDDEMYSIIKGETLGFKALIMFDLIRTFGPPPTSTSLHNSTFVAYPVDITIETYPDEIYTRYMEMLVEDLNEAERLLKPYDPVQPSITLPTNHQHWGWLSSYRSSRMNYHAVLALQARVNLWMGNKTEALEYAEEIIDITNALGANIYSLTTSTGFGQVTSDGLNINPANDLYCTGEHMFGLHYAALYDYRYTSSMWGFYMLSSYADSAPAEDLPLTQHLKDVFDDGLEYVVVANPNYNPRWDPQQYLVPEILSNDVRLARTMMMYRNTQAQPGGNYRYPAKSSPLNNANNSPNTQMPMLRLAEMYLIAAECGTLSDATDYINDLRRARWIQSDELDYSAAIGVYAEVPQFSDEAERMQWICKEYTAEFQQEGQVFFMHKRLGLDRIQHPSGKYGTDAWSGEVLMDDSKYIVPKPTVW